MSRYFFQRGGALEKMLRVNEIGKKLIKAINLTKVPAHRHTGFVVGVHSREIQEMTITTKFLNI